MDLSKIYVWGTGAKAKELMQENVLRECEILGFIDNNKKQDTFYGYRVLLPEEMEKEYDYIVVSNEEPAEILKQCAAMKIQMEKVIAVYNYRYKDLEYKAQDDLKIREQMPALGKKIQEIKSRGMAPKGEIYTCYYDAFDEERLVGNDVYNGEYYREYIRYRAFELAVKELRHCKEQEWSVAELGVFRGAFSHLINAKFRDKTFYMFDTFEGFDPEEAGRELEQGNCDQTFIEYFADNNVEMVLNSMPFKEKCVIRKGFFPQTADGLENEKYGFVSLDVDFGETTLRGLEYFYPRLTRGGYIFLHDYNHVSLSGVKKAVWSYEKKYNVVLKKFPLPDSNGTLIITK